MNRAFVALGGMLFVACFSAPPEKPAEIKAAIASATPATSTAASDAERAAYLAKIEIRGLKSRPSDSGLGRLAIIEGELKNTGDRSLDEIELTFYYLDKNGAAIGEVTTHPVLVGGLRSKTPLKPNYSRPFAGGHQDPPSDWSGRVEAKVTDVKFSPQ